MRTFLILLLVLVATASPQVAAHAKDGAPAVGLSGGGVQAGASRAAPGHQAATPLIGEAAPVVDIPKGPQPYWDTACVEEQNNLSMACLPLMETCGSDGQLMQLMVPVPGSDPTEYTKSGTPTCQFPNNPLPAPGAAAIPAFTQKEFRELPISPAKIGSQPGRHTLKGAETNIYADAGEQTFNVTLAGHAFTIKARPLEYWWAYGDGASLTTTAPGGPIPEARWGEKTVTSHVYQQTGDATVRLTTAFIGEYSVDGGPSQAIVGTAEVPSPQRTLSVWRSEVKLYADDCNTNPAGAGCR